MKYTIVFDDGIVYTSPDIREKDPGWAAEDGAKQTGIREISIDLQIRRQLILKGFEAYNFFVEASQALGEKGGARIEAFYFLGKWRGHIVSWGVHLGTGQVTKQMAIDGREYHGTATRGWRMGLMGEKARSGLCPLV